MEISFDNVEVVDEFLNDQEVKSLYHYFLNKSYVINHTSSTYQQAEVHKQSAYYLTPKDLELPLVKKVVEAVDRPFMRAYVQAYSSSMIPSLHIDQGVFTTITCFHPKYDEHWGGDTILYNDKGIGMAVQPKVGRQLRFPGSVISHVGRPFNHLATTFRFILIINYE